MNVYPTHRDFGYRDWVCDTVMKNAVTAEVVDNGLGTTGISGAIPYPFPQSGSEAIWNIINPHRAHTEKAVCDIADVYSNGSIAWGRNKFMTLNPGNDPNKRGSFTEPKNAYFYTGYLLPERDKGFVAVGYQPNNFSKDATQSWQYQPGIRRVRQAPEVCCDYPVAAGRSAHGRRRLRLQRLSRALHLEAGRQEGNLGSVLTTSRSTTRSLKHKDLIKPNTINPDYVRYELHRVWVVEGHPEGRHAPHLLQAPPVRR